VSGFDFSVEEEGNLLRTKKKKMNDLDAWTINEVHKFVKEHFSEEIADKFKGRCELTCGVCKLVSNYIWVVLDFGISLLDLKLSSFLQNKTLKDRC